MNLFKKMDRGGEKLSWLYTFTASFPHCQQSQLITALHLVHLTWIWLRFLRWICEFLGLKSLQSSQGSLRIDSPTNCHIYLSSGSHCGPNRPQDLVSDGNLLHLSFSSNDKVVDMGFAATWRAVDPTEGKTEEEWKRTTVHMEEIVKQKYLIVSLLFLSSDFLLPIVYTHAHSSLWRKLQQQSRWNCVSELAIWQIPCSVCVHMAYQHSFSKEHPHSLHSLWGASCEHPWKLCGLCGHHHWRKHGNNRSVVIPYILSVVVFCCCCLGASTLWNVFCRSILRVCSSIQHHRSWQHSCHTLPQQWSQPTTWFPWLLDHRP